ncbi:MAG: type II toxin-antitoxin system VapC family toxin [Gammaproteobacteria bacterium]|nr:type II toxin-antitoxin system VapC family toxin [Gammaproteobacteria bacterium]
MVWRWAHDPRLSQSMRDIISDPDNDIFASAASVWELEIMHAKGKLTLPGSVLEGLAKMSVPALSIDAEDAAAAATLPRHHDDPFDRMLVAQAMRRSLTIVTSDDGFKAYGVRLMPP